MDIKNVLPSRPTTRRRRLPHELLIVLLTALDDVIFERVRFLIFLLVCPFMARRFILGGRNHAATYQGGF